MQTVIGEQVRIKRGAYFRSAVQPTRVDEDARAKGNRETGIVRNVWRGDRLAYVELDRTGTCVPVALRDLRPYTPPKES